MTHHIMIASEQLWPNLLGLAALLRRDGGVRSLHIVHTGDEKRSERPAHQLDDLAKRMQPGLVPIRHKTGTTSQEVIAVVHSLLHSVDHHGQASWSINATGGTKTMFAGLTAWARLKNLEAFYREVTGAWFRLLPLDLEDLQMTQCEDWREAENTVLDLPVQDLATCQGAHPEGCDWSWDLTPAIDVGEVLSSGIKNGWNWRELQKRFPLLSQNNTGFAFEDFFGALLQAVGGGNSVIRFKMLQNGSTRQEFDALLSTGHNLVIFDLKLTEPGQAAIDQISRLAEDRRNLGGLAAAAIAIRPSWTEDAGMRAVAASHQVQLWTQSDMPGIIEKLCGLLGQQVAGRAHELDLMLRKAASDGFRIFSQSRALKTGQAPNPEEVIGWLGLDAYWAECLKQRRQALVLDLAHKLVIRIHLASIHWNTEEKVRASLPLYVALDFFYKGKDAETAMVIVSAAPENSTKMRQWARSLISQPSGATCEPAPPAAPPKMGGSNLADAFK